MPRVIFVALLILTSALADPTSLRTPQDAERAEQALASNPEDLKLRTDLIHYYHHHTMRLVGSRPVVDEAVVQRRGEHILWLVERHPEAPILGMPEGAFDHPGALQANAAARAKAAPVWRRHAASPVAPAAVLANAGYFFRLTDRELAEALLTRAHRLKPGESAYSEALGLLYAQAALGVSEVSHTYSVEKADRDVARSAFAGRARSILAESQDAAMLREAGWAFTLGGTAVARLRVRLDYDPGSLAESLLVRARRLNPADYRTLEYLSGNYSGRTVHERNTSIRTTLSRKWLNELLEYLPRASDSYQRSRILLDAAIASYAADQAPAASDYAQQALAVVQREPDAWFAGDIVHGADTVLGLVAAGRGDLPAAAQFLIASARVQGTGVLSSFGPNTMLAKTLLDKGERRPVLEFLRLCAGFWTSGVEMRELDEWTEQVQAGRTPSHWRILPRLR